MRRRSEHPFPAHVGVGLILAAALSGCAQTIARNGISDPLVAERAVVADTPGFRFWGDEVPKDAVAELRRRLPNMPQIAQNARKKGERPVVEYLALSGGGGDGAFGAGVLAGWTARGDRPEFEIVTGISAGAVIAPFAFLGPAYDDKLREIWTQYRTSELVTTQILPGLLGGAALADTSNFQDLVAQYIDQAMLDEIAAQYQRGRILFVGTTNLDAQRPVVWNMGEIAASKHPDSLALFRKVILASAAIPGAFPPVNIPVTVDGKPYEEMHVDGGVTREVFVLPVQAPFRAFNKLYPAKPIRKIYVVKNGKVTPETEVVKPKVFSIAARSISTLIKSQNYGELYRIDRMAKDDGAEFHLAAIPPTFTRVAKEFFDPQYQKALYEEGVTFGGLDASAWMRHAPGTLDEAQADDEVKSKANTSDRAKAILPPRSDPLPASKVKPVASAAPAGN